MGFHHKALVIRLSCLGTMHPNTSNSYHNLGDCMVSKKNYYEAIKYCEEALRIRMFVFGIKHPNVAENYNILGKSYLGKDNYDESFSLFQKSIQK